MGKCEQAMVAAMIAGCALGKTNALARSRPSQPNVIDLNGGSLSAGLAELSRERGIDVLVDEQLVAGRHIAPIHGRLTDEAALAALLSGTDILFRRTADGAFVLFAQRRVPQTPDDGAIAEILVVGRKTQNADIKRTENDIQPYRVFTRQDIGDAHRDNVDDFLRSRETRNGQIGSAAQDPIGRNGSNQSEISLRGLGSAQTMVLIDGRRLPAIPTMTDLLQQPDINAIPPSAIERIETLPSTAGGIYGPSATGGVVNIVLKRDFRGVELNMVPGISDVGDARRLTLQGRLGLTPDGGQTDVMLSASHTMSGSLSAGNRNYLAQSRNRALANAPAIYLARYPSGQGINIFSQSGSLVFDASLGGEALGSTVTYLPLTFSGSAVDRVAVLRANAGHIDTLPTDDSGGSKGDLLSRPTLTSGLLTIRHRFGETVEGFVDALYMRNIGKTVGRTAEPFVTITADALANPFANPVIVTYPLPVAPLQSETDFTTVRITTGMIVSLSSNWRATTDYTYAQATARFRVALTVPMFGFYGTFGSGKVGPGGLPALDPIGDAAGFIRALPSYLITNTVSLSRVNRSSEGTLRIAGPLLTLAGGPLTLTFMGSFRQEIIPVAETIIDAGNGVEFRTPSPQVRQKTRSAYAEIRAPLIARDTALPILKGLEFQAAVRFDRQASSVTRSLLGSSSFLETKLDRNAPLFTFGLRFFPDPRIMVRASVATGLLPPAIDQISSNANVVGGYDAFGIGDPRRSGRLIGTEGTFTYLTGGSPNLRAERARSMTFGVVFNPDGKVGPRLSIDVTRIRKRDEISAVYSGMPGYFIANETRFPDRVSRAALTVADADLGFTAGRITQIDTRSFNSGNTTVDAVDAQMDWTIPSKTAGEFGVHTKVTWQPILRRQKAPDLAAVNLTGYADGPLVWRSNGGIDWSRGRLSIGFNAQFFGSYRVANSSFNATARNASIVQYQGTSRIPAQLYVDLFASRRFAVSGHVAALRTIEASLGVANIFDHDVPVVANPDSAGYSPYGDPRGRRFEIRVSARL